ncbi:amidohydrolase family protein [Bradyrhizobium prioriisuperbiae]|uniref:amidohydrolase family protein n=1 Tax=Bradyrhizobium prioriisuperbiae TaxID=2854389 RepID=UPI0028ECB2AC|nr:amidohydrolase family protein [Bradyrhizobium prioritasuperba]
MTKLCLAPDPNPKPPAFTLPDNATDCHMHLFGTAPAFPYVGERDYTPAEASAEAARALYKTLGIQRFVAIQPSVYGTDNRCQLDFATAVGLPFRAIVVLSPDTSDQEMTRLHDQGVRGIRYILAHPGGLDIATLERTADRARAFGWHLEFLIKPAQLVELAPRLMKLSCPVSCDHLGFIKPELGLEQPGFQALLRLLQSDHGWVKFSGAYRVSGKADHYDAVLPFARKLAETRPERIVWGSDWPHVGQMQVMPATTPLLNLLQDWVPDEGQRRRILVDNPSEFYGFE